MTTIHPDEAFERLWNLPKELRYEVVFRWHYNQRCGEWQWQVHLGTEKTFGLVGATAEHPDLMFALAGVVRQAKQQEHQ